MEKEELNERLSQLNVEPTSYPLDQHPPDERYVLAHDQDDIWCVYYAEKGERSALREFHSEAEACLYLLDLLSSEEGARPFKTT
ncbi:hypothetical protein EON83_25290 [bacterium]|nr:MAG: hypothetical protein EON83_25290 [bacterium]